MHTVLNDDDIIRVMGEISESFLPFTEYELIGIRNHRQKHDSYRESVDVSCKQSFELSGITFSGDAIFDPEEESVITEKWDYGGDGCSFSLSQDLMAVFMEGGVKEEEAENLGQSLSMEFLNAASSAVDNAYIPNLEIWVNSRGKAMAEYRPLAECSLTPEEDARARMWLAPALNHFMSDSMKCVTFKDVDYDLSQVRNKKLVKPIYFTQFPKDLDELQNTRLKKETFIKIVLPLIVAENERILADRKKLERVSKKKKTSDLEKQWLRQKLLEYKVKKGNMEELLQRIDIIPTSIALAQAAKESGWGTSRFALEGNAIFGQWTWSGQGIAPLNRESNKNHKILKFPILRASVKAYQNNLNTHKSYIKFREKRSDMRDKNKDISGLDLTHTLGNYAQTGAEYIKILNQIIRQNRLTDFEPVRLVNSVKKIELSS